MEEKSTKRSVDDASYHAFADEDAGYPTSRPHTSGRSETMRTEHDIWVYPSTVGETSEIVGYSVEAIDGGIGKIDDATDEVGQSSLVVDTGPWIFGRKVIVPAGIVDRIDRDEECVYVNRTKEQIKNAPELDEERRADGAYRDQLGTYYGPSGPGWQDEPPRTL
jgi:hypothetical protein